MAGVAFDLVVTAEDPYGNVVTNYMGTVTFTSSDPYPGIVPADYTFQSSDEGGHPFAGLALFTAGVQMLTVQDTIDTVLTGTAALSVTPAAASHFLLAAPTMVLSSMPFDVTVTALDPYGNVDTNYAGTVTLSSTDSDPGVVLPPAYTFQASDAGTHAFPDGVTLITLGDQSLTVTDTVSGIAGSAAITVTGGGGGAASPPGGGRVRPSAPSMTADRTPTGSVQPGPQLAVVDRFFSVLEREKSSIAQRRWGSVTGQASRTAGSWIFSSLISPVPGCDGDGPPGPAGTLTFTNVCELVNRARVAVECWTAVSGQALAGRDN